MKRGISSLIECFDDLCAGGEHSPIFNDCGAEKYQKLKVKARIKMSRYLKIEIKRMDVSAMADVERICFVK